MKMKFMAAVLIAATIAPVAAQAQDHRRDQHEQRRELQQDRRELREDRRDFRQDRRQDRIQDRRDDRRDYRQDRRVGWQDYRRDHGDVFRRGSWNAPFRYRAFAGGAIAPRAYWGSRYYVNDWSRYRLPRPAYGFYRYVRHYDDVLLINTRNGRVVQVYNHFYR